MAKDTEKLIRQLSLISYLMAERRPVTANEIRSDVEGYSVMNEDAFARRFYADRSELEALQVRGAAMDQITAVPVASVSSSNFDWNDFGIGAVSMLGLVLLAGGITAGVHYSRKHTVRRRPVS